MASCFCFYISLCGVDIGDEDTKKESHHRGHRHSGRKSRMGTSIVLCVHLSFKLLVMN